MQTRYNGTPGYSIGFMLVDSSDHRTPVTGATPTIEISKSGGAYASAVGTISEVGHGHYMFDADAADIDTNGELWAYITATGADDITAHICDVIGSDPFDYDYSNSLTSITNTKLSTAHFDTEIAEIIALFDFIGASVWDQVIADHLTPGTTGEALNAAGGAGDPWITTLPGSYSAGQAGYIVGNNVDVAISSRLANADYTAPDNAGISAIDTAITNIPANVWAYIIEGTKSAAWFMRIFLSGIALKVSGASSDHPLFRDLADTKNRIDATTSADGRSSVTLDGD